MHYARLLQMNACAQPQSCLLTRMMRMLVRVGGESCAASKLLVSSRAPGCR